MKSFATLLTFFSLFSSPLLAQDETPKSWNFEPGNDAFSEDALLDLRFLNEPRSGVFGFVRLAMDGSGFVLADGSPVRFWACGSDIYKKGTPEEIDRHCRFLAKMGVNLVRLHANIANTKEGAAVTDVNEEEIEGIFRFIKAAKDHGLYLTISPYYAHHETPKSWGIEGYENGGKPWGVIFTDPKLQEGYKAWTKELYTRVNPYTELPIKDDPTVAFLQIQNEDSMFFWTFQNVAKPQLRRLAEAFSVFAKGRYRTTNQFDKEDWGKESLPGDNPAAGFWDLYTLYDLIHRPDSMRVRDQIRFMAEFQRKFYADMGRYLREDLGCRQMMNATNWRTANDAIFKDIERWTYQDLDIDAENEYYGSDYQHVGENHGYRIDPGHFLVNESCLFKPLELTTNFKRNPMRPFFVTETSWKHPNVYQSEGPWLISAYQSLGGVDAVFWFSADTERWNLDPRRMFWKVGDSHALSKWSCTTPMLVGMFPAAALTFRRSLVDKGEPVVQLERQTQTLWNREPPKIEDIEIHGDGRALNAQLTVATGVDGKISQAAFLIGPVTHQIGAASDTVTVSPTLEAGIDAAGKRLTSNTKQLEWDWGKGICKVNAPKAQGVTGFLREGGGKFDFADLTIESQNQYASVSVVTMDEDPLATSKKILVQVGTAARLTDWKTEPAQVPFNKGTVPGEKIVNAGTPPWKIASTRIKLAVRNPNIKEAVLLDPNGYKAADIPVVREGDSLVIELPYNAMYVILR